MDNIYLSTFFSKLAFPQPPLVMADRSNTSTAYEQFVLLFNRYKTPVHDYVQAITGDHYTAEEITQEIFVKLWRKQADLAQIDNIDQYIFRMARNQSMDYFKKIALDTKLVNELKNRMTALHGAQGDNVSSNLDYKDTEALIDQAVATLSPQRRRVYQLSRQQGLKLEEIAAEMQLSVNTVKNHLVRSLQEIREYLVKHHPEAWVYVVVALLKI